MTIYVVTGKLGSGKSLLAVDKIRQYVVQGRRVATNLDLKLENLLAPKRRAVDVVRIPDKPTVADLEMLGKGCDTVDEKRYGLIVLDELGVWLNARTWADKGRQGVLDWLRHSRKFRWDILFLIQHPESLDKQVRQDLMEYLVKCRRFDKIKLPIISALGEFLTFGLWDGYLPKIHLGVVIYTEGGNPQSPLVTDRWFYRAHDLYSAYDTEQVFSDRYDSGPYSYLTPWHLKGRYMPMTVIEALALWIRGQLPEQARRARPARPAARLSPLMALPPDRRWHVARALVQAGAL